MAAPSFNVQSPGRLRSRLPRSESTAHSHSRERTVSGGSCSSSRSRRDAALRRTRESAGRCDRHADERQGDKRCKSPSFPVPTHLVSFPTTKVGSSSALHNVPHGHSPVSPFGVTDWRKPSIEGTSYYSRAAIAPLPHAWSREVTEGSSAAAPARPQVERRQRLGGQLSRRRHSNHCRDQLHR